MSKNTDIKIKISTATGLLKIEGNGKITARRVPLPISDIKPENFYMNGKLTKSKNDNYYGELVYRHEGKWIKPIIALPLMKGCRFYTNALGITTITGNLSSKDYIHKRTAKRISDIHKRVLTIIENHPMLKSKKDGFPLTRFLRKKEDGPNGEKILAISAEIEQTRTVGNYTFDGTTFLDKHEKEMKGNPLSTLKDKEVDAILLIDISFIKPGQDAIYNKIKADTILINEAREIVKTRKVKFSFDFSSDDSEESNEDIEEDDNIEFDEVEEYVEENEVDGEAVDNEADGDDPFEQEGEAE